MSNRVISDQFIDIDIGSRRSKTKCNGDRPQCRSCLKRKVACLWPQSDAPNTFYALTPPQEQQPLRRNQLEPRVHHQAIPHISSLAKTPLILPEPHLLQRLFHIFFSRHHEAELCSFLHKPSLDIPTMAGRSPLLVASVISLAALYVSADKAEADFGFETPTALSEHYACAAKSYTYGLCDEPSSKWRFVFQFILRC